MAVTPLQYRVKKSIQYVSEIYLASQPRSLITKHHKSLWVAKFLSHSRAHPIFSTKKMRLPRLFPGIFKGWRQRKPLPPADLSSVFTGRDGLVKL